MRWITSLLAASLVAPSLPAQQGNSLVNKDARLKIFVLQGAGAYNSLRDRASVQTVVEVRDELNQPVRGAGVVFQLPADGPGGHFDGQKLEWTGKTDSNGQVAASALLPNGRAGRFNIQVSATHGQRAGYSYISQTNGNGPALEGGTRRKGKLPGWAKAALIVGGAAAAGGIVWGVRRGDGRPDVVLQPGTISLGSPR